MQFFGKNAFPGSQEVELNLNSIKNSFRLNSARIN